MSTPSDFDRFSALISDWRETYSYKSTHCVCLKVGEANHLIAGRIVLLPNKDNFRPVNLNTERIYAFSYITKLKAADIDDVLTLAQNGGVNAPDGKLFLDKNTNGHGFSTHFFPTYHPSISEGPRLPTLSVRGPSKHELLAKIDAYARPLDWELKSADTPFESLDELLLECGLPNQQSLGDSAVLEVVARSPGNLTNESRISSGKALFHCRISTSADTEKVKIGYKIFRKDTTERGAIAGKSFQWTSDELSRIGTHELELGDAAVVQAFLSYSKIAVHQWWLTDPDKFLNPRLAIHKIFDPTLDILKKLLLNPEGDRAMAFEWGVSTLFYLLGFSTNGYGRLPKLQDGPDVIATAPTGNVAVIECTVGLLDRNDKLAKLVQREKLIKDNLKKAQHSHAQVQPVIVTLLTRAEVAAQLDTARTHRIVVITRETIEDLLQRIDLPPHADTVFTNLVKTLPNIDDLQGLIGPS